MTAIIILNWHGADDTIACLESLRKAEGDFRVYVVDNGSTDDSVNRISAWIDANTGLEVELCPLDKNYGFAKGNNKGIARARTLNPDSYLLLNNDTEVEPDFLIRLQDFSKRNPQYRVLTPRINYYYDKNKVWNCGGHLFFGFRKYYYAGSPASTIKEKGYIPVSFVTGCALYFYPEVLNEEGALFTERFFFGEEDFELSMRLHKENKYIACVLDSLIYHKVGASIGRSPSVSKVYLHNLNRFINVRLHFGVFKYVLWLLLSVPILFKHLYGATNNLALSFKLARSLVCDACKKDGVTQTDFKKILNGEYFTYKV
ncbi:MAG: glycosyltransferase family 2 protein [Bacteroidaceae bacterium]|nr:glycosyltransferase family 2 protein [Bacteroidaceae bacterium]